MAVKLGDAFVALGTKDELDKGLNAARVKVNGFIANLGQGIGQGIGQALANTIGRALSAGLDQIGKATTAANSLNQSIIRTQKVFGDSADEIRAWAQTADRSLGLSEQAALANASALGNMLTQLGANREQAALMSRQMVETAADLAVFHNVTGGAAEVLDTMSSAFRGEYDALQRFLPAITDAAIKQQALADTGKESGEQLTALEKALATQTLIFQGTTSAAGAYADAIASGAAAQNEFAARLENASAELGQVGLIIQREFFQTLNELLEEMGFYGENIVEQLVVGLTKGLTAITPFLAQLRGVFTYWLKPGSPPRLLKDLTEWGKGAAAAYLEGWGDVDFNALDALGAGIESALRSFAGAGQLKETDLVRRIFGSQRATIEAINEWRQLGSVSAAALENIARAAGPAGGAVADLVREYFDLQRATERTAQAQDELNAITDRYANALNPLNEQLEGVRARQQLVRENQELERLGQVLRDPNADVEDRELARLQAEEIQLERQARAIEDERDTALDAAQQKIDAAKAEQDAAQRKHNAAKAILDQQVQTNNLIAEELTLRQRLANEALAAQEKALRELEAQRAKEAAELERINDAHLRYRLAIADDAGQLAILQEELAKTTEGSAEYWAILTDIAQIQERIASDSGGASIAPGIVETGKAALENKQYLEDFRLALEGATGALFGGDDKPVELNPFWADVAETVKTTMATVGEAIGEGKLIIQGFIDLFTGESPDVPTADILRPTGAGGGGFFGSIVPGLRGLVSTLTLIKDGEWGALWNQFKVQVNDNLNATILSGDPTGIGLYVWLQDSLIPALEALAEGDWRAAWEKMGGTAAEALVAGFVTSDRMVALQTFMIKFLLGDIVGALEALGIGTPAAPAAPESGSPSGGDGLIPEDTDWWKLFLDALRRSLPGITPPSLGRPQFQGFDMGNPSISPAFAGTLPSAGNVTGDNLTFFIEQNIASNGDFGGARQGAQEGIRQALLNRKTA